MSLSVENEESVSITNVSLTLGLKEGQELHLDHSSEYSIVYCVRTVDSIEDGY